MSPALPIVRRALALARPEPMPQLWAYEVWSPMTAFDWPEDITPVMEEIFTCKGNSS